MKHLMMKRIDLDEAKGNEDLHLCSISYDPKKFKNAYTVLENEGFRKNDNFEKDKKKKSGDIEYYIVLEKDDMAFNAHFNNLDSKGIRALAKKSLVITAQGHWRKAMEAKAGIVTEKQQTAKIAKIAEMVTKLKIQLPDKTDDEIRAIAEDII